ncbi:MAG: DNA/RNA non-specific endonuclease [Phocaeicola sp.]
MTTPKKRKKRATTRKKSNPPILNFRSILLALLVGAAVYAYENIDFKALLSSSEQEDTTEYYRPENSSNSHSGGNSTGGSKATTTPNGAITGLEIPVLQSRSGGQIIHKKGFTLSYSADYKTPQWVAWELTRQETTGSEGRTNKFLPDPDVRGAKAYTGDYTNSGYDRGHMAPAGDMKWSAKAMEESFYLSNICPQNPNLNRGDWKDLEEKSRAWAQKYGAIYIACGPIYDNPHPKRIGNNKVGVPDAFYKVILLNYPKNPQAIGFLFDNKSGHQSLHKYMVTVDSIEKRTNIDFFSALPDAIEKKIEATLHKQLP